MNIRLVEKKVVSYFPNIISLQDEFWGVGGITLRGAYL